VVPPPTSILPANPKTLASGMPFFGKTTTKSSTGKIAEKKKDTQTTGKKKAMSEIKNK
jgi:hypothetical protein